MTNKEPNPFVKMASKGLAGALDKLAEKSDDIRTPGFVNEVLRQDEVQESGANLITLRLNDTVKDVTDNAGPLVKDGAEKLNPDNKGTYAMIRENLGSPTDSLFKKIVNNIVGRVIDVGSGIAGFIGAAFVNKLFKPATPVEGKDVHNIFASFMSKAMGGVRAQTAVPATA